MVVVQQHFKIVRKYKKILHCARDDRPFVIPGEEKNLFSCRKADDKDGLNAVNGRKTAKHPWSLFGSIVIKLENHTNKTPKAAYIEAF